MGSCQRLPGYYLSSTTERCQITSDHEASSIKPLVRSQLAEINAPCRVITVFTQKTSLRAKIIQILHTFVFPLRSILQVLGSGLMVTRWGERTGSSTGFHAGED